MTRQWPPSVGSTFAKLGSFQPFISSGANDVFRMVWADSASPADSKSVVRRNDDMGYSY